MGLYSMFIGFVQYGVKCFKRKDFHQFSWETVLQTNWSPPNAATPSHSFKNMWLLHLLTYLGICYYSILVLNVLVLFTYGGRQHHRQHEPSKIAVLVGYPANWLKGDSWGTALTQTNVVILSDKVNIRGTSELGSVCAWERDSEAASETWCRGRERESCPQEALNWESFLQSFGIT